MPTIQTSKTQTGKVQTGKAQTTKTVQTRKIQSKLSETRMLQQAQQNYLKEGYTYQNGMFVKEASDWVGNEETKYNSIEIDLYPNGTKKEVRYYEVFKQRPRLIKTETYDLRGRITESQESVYKRYNLDQEISKYYDYETGRIKTRIREHNKRKRGGNVYRVETPTGIYTTDDEERAKYVAERYGINPERIKVMSTVEFANLYGKAGHIKKAEDIIKESGYKDKFIKTTTKKEDNRTEQIKHIPTESTTADTGEKPSIYTKHQGTITSVKKEDYENWRKWLSGKLSFFITKQQTKQDKLLLKTNISDLKDINKGDLAAPFLVAGGRFTRGWLTPIIHPWETIKNLPKLFTKESLNSMAQDFRTDPTGFILEVKGFSKSPPVKIVNIGAERIAYKVIRQKGYNKIVANLEKNHGKNSPEVKTFKEAWKFSYKEVPRHQKPITELRYDELNALKELPKHKRVEVSNNIVKTLAEDSSVRIIGSSTLPTHTGAKPPRKLGDIDIAKGKAETAKKAHLVAKKYGSSKHKKRPYTTRKGTIIDSKTTKHHVSLNKEQFVNLAEDATPLTADQLRKHHNLFDLSETAWVKTPKGIKTLSVRDQLRAKIWAGHLEGRIKDIVDVYETVKQMKKRGLSKPKATRIIREEITQATEQLLNTYKRKIRDLEKTPTIDNVGSKKYYSRNYAEYSPLKYKPYYKPNTYTRIKPYKPNTYISSYKTPSKPNKYVLTSKYEPKQTYSPEEYKPYKTTSTYSPSTIYTTKITTPITTIKSTQKRTTRKPEKKKIKHITAYQPIVYDEKGNKVKGHKYATAEEAINEGAYMADELPLNKYTYVAVPATTSEIKKGRPRAPMHKFRARGKTFREKRYYTFDKATERGKGMNMMNIIYRKPLTTL